MKTSILLIIPCFNEAARLDTKAFLDFLIPNENIRLLFVNDGSSDSTGKALDALAGKNPKQINCLHLPVNAGKAEAVRRGFLKGFTEKPEFIGYFDADLAAPLSCVPELKLLLDPGVYDIAIGSRVKLLGRRIERNSTRHYLGRVFATFSSLILDLPVYDTQCGAKLFRRTEILERVFAYPFVTKWTFDVEVLARMSVLLRARNAAGLINICVELPLMEWIDRKGSKVKPWDFITSGGDIFKLFMLLHIHRRNHPYWKNLLP